MHTFLRLAGLAVWERCVYHVTTDVYFLIEVSPDDVSFSIEGTCGQLDAAWAMIRNFACRQMEGVFFLLNSDEKNAIPSIWSKYRQR